MNGHLDFTKAEGSGNDFIIIDNRAGRVAAPSETAARLCRRRLAVGADGLLLLEKSGCAAFRMRYFNADGSEAEMCGNGLRCFIVFLVSRGLAEPGVFVPVETGAGIRQAKAAGREATVGLGPARDVRTGFPISLPGRSIRAGFANTGVPHVVIEVENLEKEPVRETGRLVRQHPLFSPAGTNVNFARVSGGRIFIRTYERGVEDETLSCGTGTAAVAVILDRAGRISLPVAVTAASGETLGVSETEDGLFLSGRASLVYEGRVAG